MLITVGRNNQQEIDEEIRKLESQRPNALTSYKSVRTLRNLFFHPTFDGPKQYRVALRDLKVRRNSHNPACRVPFEILSDIFLTAQALSRFDSDSYEQWLGPTAVCQHWRQIVLDTPRFWSDILVAKLHLTSTMIQRSKGVPLRLCFNLHFINHQLIAELHAASMVESERVEEMHIRFNRYNPLDYTLMPTSSTVPALQRLILEQTKLGEPAILPKGIIFQDLPSLRTLKLISVCVPHDLPDLPSLQNFEVDFRGYLGRDLSILQLTSLLVKMPCLETLKVGTVSSSGVYPDVLEAEVLLPHLRSLDLTLQDLGDAKIFQYLAFPDACPVWTQYRTGNRPDGLHDIVRLLETRTQLPIHRGTLSFHGTTTIELELYRGDDDQTPIFKLKFPYHTLSSIYRTQFLTFSPLTRVLEMEISFVSSEQDFGDLFAVLDRKMNIITLDLNTVDCSTESRAGQVNADTLLSVLKEHAMNNNPVNALNAYNCKMSKAFIDELSRYTQVGGSLRVF